MYIADLHIHSRFSRATSGDCDAPHLDLWARNKGIQLVGTGDFTHPQWRKELAEMLAPAEEGLYTLKEEYRLPALAHENEAPRFVVTGEISTIYKRDGKTRKVHHVIILPGLEEAESLSRRLELIGNLHSDGRPILGLDSRDLLEIVLETCPQAIYVPAHIWTPHFSLFGAFSGFDSIEECFGDLTPCVHALETGLSSDPPMNRRLSALDGHVLVSNSDAHSPAKLGREANLLSCDLSFPALKRSLDTGDGFFGTIEFYPEEGKYHLDGHRPCHCRLDPADTVRYGGRCPVCGKKVTVGVLSRVEALADRSEPCPLPHPFESLMPLPELLGEALGASAASKKVQAAYADLLGKLGNEFSILRSISIQDAAQAGGFLLGEALRRLRAGQVKRIGGYDGEYGQIRLFAPGERETLLGQTTLLTGGLETAPERPIAPAPEPKPIPEEAPSPAAEPVLSLNPEQQAAVTSVSPVVAVIAGPGTGKTGTLIQRIAHLIEDRGVPARDITAVTFTRQAAQEMRSRLEGRLGKRKIQGLTVGTFHAICLKLIEKNPLISREAAREVMAALLKERGDKLPPQDALSLISARKNGLDSPGLSDGLFASYQERLSSLGVRDLDDVLLEALGIPINDQRMFRHLLVDEFQDINGIQRALVEHWSEKGELFVIGDPDQSIYGFRGADDGCFDALAQAHPQAERIRLTRNYRSTAQVVDCALSVIGKNPGEPRTLTAENGDGLPVRLIQAPDPASEGIWIAKEIARLTGGVDMLETHGADRERPRRAFSDIAVLCRTHHQLSQLERYLRHDSIPCVVVGWEDFWASDPAQATLGFFEALLEPGNLPALDRALRGLWRCPSALIQRAEAAMRLPGAPTCPEWMEALSPFDALSPFLDAVRAIAPAVRKEKPLKLMKALLDLVGASGPDLEKLLDAAVLFPDMPALLDAFRLGEEGDLRRLCFGKPSGAVRLMTLHAAKGLEFPAVILAGVNRDILPLTHPEEEWNEAEERRLFFVGITRAREELILTSGGVPSPFLWELPPGIQKETLPARSIPSAGKQLSFWDV